MKNSLFAKGILAGILMVFAVTSSPMAYTIQIADGYGIFSYGSGDGGEFTVMPIVSTINDSSTWNPILNTYNSATKNVGGTSGTFQTFCLEYGVELNDGRTYNVFSFNSQTDPGGDPVSRGTAWLYHEFQRGTLMVPIAGGGWYAYDYTDTGNGRIDDAELLQYTIWWLEGEIGDPGNGNPFRYGIVSMFGESGSKVDNNGAYPVSILNLRSLTDTRHPYRQDLLVCDPDPVPEPATMILLGSGLLGLAGIARKRLKK